MTGADKPFRLAGILRNRNKSYASVGDRYAARKLRNPPELPIGDRYAARKISNRLNYR